MLTLDILHDQCLASALSDQLNCGYLFRSYAFWMDVSHHQVKKCIFVVGTGTVGVGLVVVMPLVNEACCSKSMWAHFLAFPGTTEEGREIWFELAFRPGKC